jgi:hypothetical protein
VATRRHDHAACYQVRGVLTNRTCKGCKRPTILVGDLCGGCAWAADERAQARMAADPWVRPLSPAELVARSLVSAQ